MPDPSDQKCVEAAGPPMPIEGVLVLRDLPLIRHGSGNHTAVAEEPGPVAGMERCSLGTTEANTFG